MKFVHILLVFLCASFAWAEDDEPNRNRDLGNAAAAAKVDQVKKLLDEGGIEINWRDPNTYLSGAFVLFDSTALHRVTGCYECDLQNAADVANLLVEHGADVNLRAPVSPTGLTPLIMASFNCQAESVRMLLEHGADIKARQGVYNNTALLKACYCTQGSETARTLLDRGADTEERDSFGDTGIMIASNIGNLETVRLLLDRGADIDAKEYTEGYTALVYAAMMDKPEIVRLLLSRGASREGCDPAKWPLCNMEI